MERHNAARPDLDHIMPIAVRLKPLLEWSNAVLVKQGMYAAEAEIVSRRLIEAELLGCTAGGLRWLPRIVSAMDVGDIDPRAEIVTVTDLPALAVLNQIVPMLARNGGGSSLMAGGPGSMTFRPPIDQQVEAKGRWNDGRWTVVLRRPLDPKDGGGVKLEPGARVSAANRSI